MEGVIYSLKDSVTKLSVSITIPLESLTKFKVLTNTAILGFIDTHLVVVREKDGLVHILSTEEMMNYIRVLCQSAPRIVSEAALVYAELKNIFSEQNDEWSLTAVYSPHNKERLSLTMDQLYFLPLKELLDDLVFIKIESMTN